MDFSQSSTLSDVLLNRRDILAAGGAIAAAQAMTGPGQASKPPVGPRSIQAKNLIWIEVNGALSQLDTLDPKPEAPEATRGPYSTIATRWPGVRFTELLPRLAGVSDKIRLIRSMHQTVPGSAHTDGSHRIMTGQSDVKLDHPYFGSVLARLHPSTQPVPSYVWIQETIDVDLRYRLGGAYAPFFVTAGWGGESAYGPNYQQRLGVEGTFAAAYAGTKGDLMRRFELLEQIYPAEISPADFRLAHQFRQLQQNALGLLTSEDTRQAFALDQEPESLRQEYGLTPIGQNLLTARRLIERGVRAVAMPAWTGDYPGHRTNSGGRNLWDHHYPGMFQADFAGGYGFMVPRLDRALAALVTDLDQRGLLDSTLVVLTSEMGSSPQIDKYGNLDINLNAGGNQDARGRGHWPQCWTALLAGAGITGGVYGSSDRYAGSPDGSRAVSPEIFGATIYQALGIPPETLLDPANPLSRLSTGQPLMEIFS